MSLQYIVGSSGSGKSTYIYKKIIQEAMEHLDRNYLVIVPEQYTMATQRLLVELHPNHCIMNIDVLSFNRLAYRVFDELGISTLGVLEDTGKSLVLRSLVPTVDDRLGVLKNKLKRPGYIAQLKSLISEMTQYQITPEILKNMINHPSMSVSFKNKANDLLVMYEAFLDYNVAHGLTTTESILSILDENLDDSQMVVGSTIVLDGFTGFTPIQYQLFAHLLKACEDVYVTLTFDNQGSLLEAPAMEDLFFMSKTFAGKMSRIASQVGCKLQDPYVCDGSNGRLANNLVLNHLESSLFRSSFSKYKEDATDNIKIWTYQDSRAELSGVATEIQKLIREGMRYQEIAVVCTSLDAYRYQVAEIFDKLSIPYFIDAKSSIVFHPMLEAISALFAMQNSRYSSKDVFRFLRSGFTALTSDEIDLLENYVISTGIRGKKKYFGAFASKSSTFYEPEDITFMNELREKFVAPFIEFDKAVGSGTHTVKQIATALYSFIVAFDMESQTDVRGQWHEDNGRAVKAKEYQQIYRIIMDLLDKMVSILGEEAMSLSEFYDILESGINAASVGVIPPSKDSVVIGDMERTRLGDIKVLFLIGASDTAIPKPVENGGILSQLEREQLLANDFEMAPSDKERAFIQKFYLYLILTKPSERLYVFFPSVDGEGKGVRKSYLVDTLLKLFPTVSLQSKLEPVPEEKLLSKAGAMDYLIYLMQQAASEGLNTLTDSEVAYLAALLDWYGLQGKLSQDLISKAFAAHEEDPIAGTVKAAINEAFGEDGVITGSVSRFETYAGCGYRYFLQYVLGLQEREEFELSPLDIGNFYHAALEQFGRLLLADNIKWHDVTDEIKETYIEKAISSAYEQLPKAEALDDAKQAYIFDVVKETLRFGVEVLIHQVKQGSFEPAAYEKPIHSHILDGSGNDAVVIKGKVDRIDISEQGDDKFVRIIDYKSSARAFDIDACYYGLSMQLPIYLKLVMDELAHKYPSANIHPSGLLYYKVENPYVDSVGKTDSQLMDDRKQLQRMDGLVVGQLDQVLLHDQYLSDNQRESTAIHATVKAGGNELRGGIATTAVDEAGFYTLLDYAAMNACEISKKIKDCDFRCRPAEYKNKLNCDSFCPFKSVCHFDPLEPGFETNSMPKGEDTIALMQDKLDMWKGEKDNGLD